MTEGSLLQQSASASAQSGATSMGKGAWDCDARKAIPPEKEVREKRKTSRRRGQSREQGKKKPPLNKKIKNSKTKKTGRGL